MELARMTCKGQLTIPIAIRQKLGVGTGDQLLFYEQDGRMVIAPVSPASLADAHAAACREHIYTVEEIRSMVLPIAKKHRLTKLSLFGSYARGDASANSDLDFLVEAPENFSLLNMSALRIDLEEAFHKSVDLISEGPSANEMSERFRSNIKEDEVVLYGGH